MQAEAADKKEKNYKIRIMNNFVIGHGLSNLGNTCYLNSVIQCLTHTAPLAGLCLNGYFSRRIKASNESSLNIFVCHVQRALSKHGGGAFAPKSIIRKLRTYSRTFRVGRQEDAHEFLRTFLGSLQKSCLRASGQSSDDVSPVAETTSIYHVFGGPTKPHKTEEKRGEERKGEAFVVIFTNQLKKKH